MYKAGHFYMPTSGGSFSVDCGVEPQAVIFFGGNVATEDSFVSGGTPGVFYGMAWRDQATNAIDQQASTNTSAATGFQPLAIHMFTGTASVDYEASVTSFNSNGFTINVINPASASRLVHYLVLTEFEGCEGSTMASTSNATYTFSNLGYRPLTALSFHHWPNGADRDVAANNNWVFSMGCRNFPEDLNIDRNSAQSIMARVQTQLGGVGWTDQFKDFIGETITLTIRPGSVGTILQADDKSAPRPNPDSEGIFWELNGYPTRHSGLWWSGEGSCHDAVTPNLAAQTIITARDNVPEIEAALFFGTMGYTNTAGTNPQVLYMHGVITADYQGCVGYSSGIGSGMSGTPGFFQSKQYCYVDNLRSPGPRVASGELVGNQLILTGEIEDSAFVGRSFVNLYAPEIAHQQFFRRIQ